MSHRALGGSRRVRVAATIAVLASVGLVWPRGLGARQPQPAERGAVVHALGVCGFDCCRPLNLHLHAGADLRSGLSGDPEHVGLSWSPVTTTVSQPRVPVHFAVTYRAEHGASSDLRSYEGVIPADPGAAGPDGVVRIGEWPPAERIGACGQERLTERMPGIVHVFQGVNLPGRPPCGQVAMGPPSTALGCFSDTDYDMRIARTIQPDHPMGKTLCFHSIRFWLHPGTDSHSNGADDPAILVQHDYDDRLPEAAQCPASDQYRLVATPQLVLPRDRFELEVPNVPRRCVLAPSWAGGQSVEACVAGVFERLGR